MWADDGTGAQGGAEERLAGFPLESDTSFLLARANARSVSLVNSALAPLGLKVRLYSVLALAGGGERPSQRDLASFLRLDPSQVVALVDELESRGLVERVPDPSDRRTNAVVATLAGVDLADRARAALAGAEAAVYAGLDADDRRVLGALLRNVAFWD